MFTISLIVMVVGLLIYLLVDPALRGGRILEVGRVMFWTGLLAYLLASSGRSYL